MAKILKLSVTGEANLYKIKEFYFPSGIPNHEIFYFLKDACLRKEFGRWMPCPNANVKLQVNKHLRGFKNENQ